AVDSHSHTGDTGSGAAHHTRDRTSLPRDSQTHSLSSAYGIFTSLDTPGQGNRRERQEVGEMGGPLKLEKLQYVRCSIADISSAPRVFDALLFPLDGYPAVGLPGGRRGGKRRTQGLLPVQSGQDADQALYQAEGGGQSLRPELGSILVRRVV